MRSRRLGPEAVLAKLGWGDLRTMPLPATVRRELRLHHRGGLMERYEEALRNQQESIRLQQTGLRRVRVILAFATIAVILAVGMLVLLLLRVVARLP
jgi:hypothetical protein